MADEKTNITAKSAHSPEQVEELHHDPDREDYAEHLARVTPDADRNKALLQARYRALHDEDPDHPDSH